MVEQIEYAQRLSAQKIGIMGELLRAQQEKLYLFKIKLDADKMEYVHLLHEKAPARPCTCPPKPSCPPQIECPYVRPPLRKSIYQYIPGNPGVHDPAKPPDHTTGCPYGRECPKPKRNSGSRGSN